MGSIRKIPSADLHLGQRLALAMRLAGASSADLAAAVAVEEATVAQWLSGERRIGSVTVCKACEVLGVSIAALFVGKISEAGSSGAACIQLLMTENATFH